MITKSFISRVFPSSFFKEREEKKEEEERRKACSLTHLLIRSYVPYSLPFYGEMERKEQTFRRWCSSWQKREVFFVHSRKKKKKKKRRFLLVNDSVIPMDEASWLLNGL